MHRCVGMFLCVHRCIVCICEYMWMHENIREFVCMCLYVRESMCVHICKYVHIRMCIRALCAYIMCAGAQECAYMCPECGFEHICMHVQRYICMCVHVCICAWLTFAFQNICNSFSSSAPECLKQLQKHFYSKYSNIWGQSNCIGSTFALHVAYSRSIPSIIDGPLSFVRGDPWAQSQE